MLSYPISEAPFFSYICIVCLPWLLLTCTFIIVMN